MLVVPKLNRVIVCFISAMLVPEATYSTSIAFIRSDSRIVVAADSKDTVTTVRGRSYAGNHCKIHVTKTVIYGFANLTEERKTGFSAPDIANAVIIKSSTLEEIANRFAASAKIPLTEALVQVSRDFPKIYQAQLR